MRLLAVGRISPEKGTHVLLDAFARLVETHPRVELDVVGEEGMPAPEMLAGRDGHERVRALLPLYRPGYLADMLARMPAAATGADQAPTAPSRMPMFPPFTPRPTCSSRRRSATSHSGCRTPREAPPGSRSSPPAPAAPSRSSRTASPACSSPRATSIRRPLRARKRIVADAGLRHRLGAAGRERAVERFSWDVIAPATLAVYRGAITSS